MYKIEKKQDQYENYILFDTNTNSSCTITPQKGGMCTSYIVNGEEMIYINEPNYFSDERTRCAFPILFPTTGLCDNDTLVIDSIEYPMGIHGIAHAQAWDVVKMEISDYVSITIRLCANEQTKKSYPYEFQYDLTYTLKDGKLTMDIHIHNNDVKDMLFSFGFHPYFKVSNVQNLIFNLKAERIQNQEGVFEPCKSIPFPYAEETKVTLANVSSPCSFIDKETGKEIVMKYEDDIHYVILWSLCKQNFLCMEPWNTLPNDLNKGKGEHIPPMSDYRTSISFEVKG